MRGPYHKPDRLQPSRYPYFHIFSWLGIGPNDILPITDGSWVGSYVGDAIVSVIAVNLHMRSWQSVSGRT